MKKVLLFMAGLIAAVAVNAQSLDQIVKSHEAAMKSDKLAGITTIKISGKVSAMGMEMPMTMYMKNPNKIKVAYSFNGQDMVSVFDGEKGYMVNPMTGSSAPVELTGDPLTQIQNNNLFKNQIADFFKSGKLTLEGQENVNDKPTFKLKANIGANPVYLFIDKSSYLLVKTSATVEQMGAAMNVDSYPSDYVDVKGVILPKKTTAKANGMDASVITFDTIEVNIPIEDSIFKIK
jgi:outer membrane lipoprotein-sorting protein